MPGSVILYQQLLIEVIITYCVAPNHHGTAAMIASGSAEVGQILHVAILVVTGHYVSSWTISSS